jgi:signal transduction histidine kinase
MRAAPGSHYAGAVLEQLRSLWNEPALAPPRAPPLADRVLALVVAAIAIVEGLLRDDLPSRPAAIALGLVLALTLAFRRTHTFAAFAVGFGAAFVVSVAEIIFDLDETTLHSSICLLLLPYSLLRQCSGRQAALGLALMASVFGLAAVHGEMRGATDVIGGAVVLLFPAVLGASVRFRANARERELEHVRAHERERLARELHDTVAHHVAAIAVQAQAGRVVLTMRPDAARGALEAIEQEAARTLAELRLLVGALRDEPAALAPQARLADIEALARSAGDAPRIEVELAGELEGLRPPLEAALYRIAQESITNARRHARRASRVRVHIEADASTVRLIVHDDGETPRARGSTGYGIVGMTERAALLGGTLTAGPSDEGGWTVEAALPRDGSAR